MDQADLEKNEIIIRNYRTSDYESTLEMLKQLQDIYDIGLNEEKWRESSGLRQFKPNLKRITLIAEYKPTGEVIGMGNLEASKNTLGQFVGYLDNWATKKEYIGKRVGEILAKRAIQILKSWGCEAIRINIGYHADKKLIDVIGKVGFKPILITLEKRLTEED